MITLLGSLLGFGTSFLPEILNFFKRGQEQKHELKKMQLQRASLAKTSECQIEDVEQEAALTEPEG